jgi:flagellar assembly factor FliW
MTDHVNENEVTDGAGDSSGKTVKISTSRFGVLEVSEEIILDFPFGIIGFEKFTRFVILEGPRPGPFKWLQCVGEPELAFVITEPEAFFEDYDVSVTPETLESVKLLDVEKGIVLAIVTVSRQPAGVFANLQGPILLNPEARIARQVVLQVEGYGTRHPLPLRQETDDQVEKDITFEGEAC